MQRVASHDGRLFPSSLVFLVASFLIATALSPAQAANPAGNLDQGSNGKLSAPTSPVQWQNGDLNQNNSHFIEGFSVPYRLILTDLPLGTHNVKIEWDIRDNSKNALDYITHFQRLEPHTSGPHDGERWIRSWGSGSAARLRPRSQSRTELGRDRRSPVNRRRASTRYRPPNGHGRSIRHDRRQSYVSQGSLTAAHSSTQLSIDFTATNATVVLAWGGHIASAGDWGHGTRRLAHRFPYHTRFNRAGRTGRESGPFVEAEAVIPPPTASSMDPESSAATDSAPNRVTTDGINPSFLWRSSPIPRVPLAGSTTLDSVVGTQETSGAFTLRVSSPPKTAGLSAIPRDREYRPDMLDHGSRSGMWRGHESVYKGAIEFGASYLWSITGNGTIVGSATVDSVRVNAGTSGSFTLSLAVSKDGCTSECEKQVTVNPVPSCSITGPDPVCSQATDLTYRTTPVAAATYAWSISATAPATPAYRRLVHSPAACGSFTISVPSPRLAARAPAIR